MAIKEFMLSGVLHDKRFATGLNLPNEFATLLNRKRIGLEVTWTAVLTTENSLQFS